MEKPISEWTLEELEAYCKARKNCDQCRLNNSPWPFCELMSSDAFLEYIKETPQSLPKSDHSIGRYTLEEAKDICAKSSECRTCKFWRGSTCGILKKPLWWLLGKPIVFTETEKEIAKSLLNLWLNDTEKTTLCVSGAKNSIYAKRGSTISKFEFPIDLFPTMQAHNLKSVTLAEILKEDKDA